MATMEKIRAEDQSEMFVATKARMVGTGRFELPTPRTPSECSTRLSHVPTRKESAVKTADRVDSRILHYPAQPV